VTKPQLKIDLTNDWRNAPGRYLGPNHRLDAKPSPNALCLIIDAEKRLGRKLSEEEYDAICAANPWRK